MERRVLGFLTSGERGLFPVPIRDQPLIFQLEYDKTIHVHYRLRIGSLVCLLGAALLIVAAAVTLTVIRAGLRPSLCRSAANQAPGRTRRTTRLLMGNCCHRVIIFLQATGVPDLHEE
jgi:hypothetical protein